MFSYTLSKPAINQSPFDHRVTPLKVEIFFCLGGQGHPGTWLSIFIADVDDYHERITRLGATVIHGLQDEPWGNAENSRARPQPACDPIRPRHSQREPKMEIERVPFETRIEKRLAALMGDLARRKGMTVGEMLKEKFLHGFEKGGFEKQRATSTWSGELIKASEKREQVLNPSPLAWTFDRLLGLRDSLIRGLFAA